MFVLKTYSRELIDRTYSGETNFRKCTLGFFAEYPSYRAEEWMTDSNTSWYYKSYKTRASVKVAAARLIAKYVESLEDLTSFVVPIEEAYGLYNSNS